VRQVDRHSEILGLGNGRTSVPGQTIGLTAFARSAEGIVEPVNGSEQPHAGIVKIPDVGSHVVIAPAASADPMRTLDADDTGNDLFAGRPVGQECFKVVGGFDQPQFRTLVFQGSGGSVLEPVYLVKGPRPQIEGRAALHRRQQRVGVRIAAVDAIAPRRTDWTFRDDREHLQRYIALAHAGNIRMPKGRTLQQIAFPFQRVDVKIGDEHGFMKGGFIRCRFRRLGVEAIGVHHAIVSAREVIECGRVFRINDIAAVPKAKGNHDQYSFAQHPLSRPTAISADLSQIRQFDPC
jgi:hypothetical protein